MVVVGTRKKGKLAVGAVEEALHVPLKVNLASEAAEEVELDPVGNGNTPIPTSDDFAEVEVPVPVVVLDMRGEEVAELLSLEEFPVAEAVFSPVLALAVLIVSVWTSE
jgi:hypothetical protein